MYFRITIDFGGRSLQDFCPYSLGQPKHVYRTVDAGLGRLNGIILVVHGTGRTSQIEDFIDFQIKRKSYVVPDDLELGTAEESTEVVLATSVEVIHAQHFMPGADQFLTQVGAEETCTTCHQNALSST